MSTRALINVPDWIKIVDSDAPAGREYWNLKQVEYWDDQRSGGTHHIYAQEPHDPSVRMEVSNGQETWMVALDKPSNEPATNFAMWGGNYYSAKLEGASDVIEGMHMPSNHHASFILWWERTIKKADESSSDGSGGSDGGSGGSDGSTTGMNLNDALIKRGEQVILMELNPNAALQKVIFAEGFVPISEEFELIHDGILYMAQTASRLSDGKIRVFYALHGDWDNVTWVEK